MARRCAGACRRLLAHPRGRPLVERKDDRAAGRRNGRARPPVIRCTRSRKTYELGQIRVRALRHVSLRIERGDFVAIMGSSGSGKSTLMNILGCLDIPTSGRYLIDGVDVRGLDEDDLPTCATARSGSSFRASTSSRAPVRSPTSNSRSPTRESPRRAPPARRTCAARRRNGQSPAPSAVRALRRPAAARRGSQGDRDQPIADPRR